MTRAGARRDPRCPVCGWHLQFELVYVCGLTDWVAKCPNDPKACGRGGTIVYAYEAAWKS